MLHPDTCVQSSLTGLGVFARRDFKFGDVLWIMDDFDIKIPVDTYRGLAGGLRHKFDIYSYIDVHNRAIIPWDEGKYVNHSCEANTTGLVEFDHITIAMRDIKAGEEIVEDYGCYCGHFETFACLCATPQCRRLITPAQSRTDMLLNLEDIAPLLKSGNQELLQIDSAESREFLALLARV